MKHRSWTSSDAARLFTTSYFQACLHTDSNEILGFWFDINKGLMTEKLEATICNAFQTNAIENGHMTKQEVTTLILEGQSRLQKLCMGTDWRI